MGTRAHVDVAGQAYSVTFNTRDRRPIFRDGDAARLFLGTVHELREELRFFLLAYAVMPDHVHLLIVPQPGTVLARVMQYIKGRFSRAYNARGGTTGRVWQPRYFEAAVRNRTGLERAIAYIEGNPVRAGLAQDAMSYPFSSASGEHDDLAMYLEGDQ